MTRPRLRDPGILIGTLVLTLITSLGVASAGTSVGRVNLAGRQGASYARDDASFSPFSSLLVDELLGRLVFRQAPPVGRRTVVARETPRDAAEGDDDVQPGAPRLVAQMRSDRVTAGRGDRITYTIVVSNAGPVAATNAVLESHVPEHTTLIGGGQCGPTYVKVDPEGACVDVSPVFAAPAPGEHGVVFRFPRLASYSTEIVTFSVRVGYDAPKGESIENHSHLSAENASASDSRAVAVRVT